MGHSSSSHVVEDVPVRQLSERRVRGLGEHLSPRLLQALREAVGSETPRDPLHSHLLHSTALHYSVSPSTMGDFLRDLADAALSLATDPITPSDMHRLLAFLAVVPYESDLTVEQDDAQRAQALAGQLSPNAIVSWYSTSLHIKALWNQLVNTLVLDKEPTTLPAYGSNILTPVDVFSLHLSLDLSPLKKKWSRVFSTETHGKSWTVFTDQVAWPQSSLVIVKDKNEYVFGGMGSKPWDPAPNFFGDTECRLFSLQPRLRVYRPSGLNNHYQYFEAHARTLVNGLGFGGQVHNTLLNL